MSCRNICVTNFFVFWSWSLNREASVLFCFSFCAYSCIGKSTSLSLQKCCIMYSYHENATCSSHCIPGDDNNADFLHLLRQITSEYPKSNCREECGVRPANDGSYCLMGNSILPVSWILPRGTSGLLYGISNLSTESPRREDWIFDHLWWKSERVPEGFICTKRATREFYLNQLLLPWIRKHV